MDAEDEVRRTAEVHGKGHVGGAGIHRSKFGEYPHRAALGKQRDFVALLQTECHEAGADTVCRLTGLLLGYLRPYAVNFLAKINVIGKLVAVLLNKVNNGRSGFLHIIKNQWFSVLVKRRGRTSAHRSCRSLSQNLRVCCRT